MQIPIDMRIDKDGLLYLDDPSILRNYILLDNNIINSKERYYQYGFFKVPGNDDYILKYCYTALGRKECKNILNMLENIEKIRNYIPNIDFPIGYYKRGRNIQGTIIPYYNNAISLRNIINNYTIEDLQGFYNHADNPYQNLIALYLDILNILEEMFNHKMSYFDIHAGNFVIKNNEVKIIDFEPWCISFDNTAKNFDSICFNYLELIQYTMQKLNIDGYQSDDYARDFSDVKEYVKSLGSNIRGK